MAAGLEFSTSAQCGRDEMKQFEGLTAGFLCDSNPSIQEGLSVN